MSLKNKLNNPIKKSIKKSAYRSAYNSVSNLVWVPVRGSVGNSIYRKLRSYEFNR